MERGQLQNSNLTWVHGVPVSTRFDDPYFSDQDGLAESQHVFLAGNGLPERFAPGFQIAELGFGTGLNLLATWQAWEAAGQTSALKFTSFEKYPMQTSDMKTALAHWPSLARYAERFFDAFDPNTGATLSTLDFNIIIGDANDTLQKWKGRADAWFLDGFSPAKNPDMWSAALMQQIAKLSNPNAGCATYSAAGHVRRNLAAAGFDVSRAQGYGRKRHMTVARLTHAK